MYCVPLSERLSFCLSRFLFNDRGRNSMFCIKSRPNHRLAWAIPWIAALACVAPKAACASCGHGATSVATRSNQASFLILEGLSVSDPVSDTSRPEPDRPCTGQFCSSQRGSLPRTPGTLPSTRIEAVTHTEAAVRISPSEGLPFAVRPVSYPRPTASRLERPPRP
jgi:hypothetical protein